MLSFARALGEFGATITFAGSLEGVTRTLPLEIYLQRETDPDAAVALSLVLVVVAVLVIGLVRGSRSTHAVSLQLAAGVAARDVDVALEVADGQTVAILGPNGAGKSTLLSVIAGILRPDTGHATLDGSTLFDTTDGTWLPPHRRGTALLAQDPLLFPHLDALDNVAFGPRSSGASRGRSRDIARDWLAEVDAGDLADRRPSDLSGGQAQRVAIARALAAEHRGCCCWTSRWPRWTSPSCRRCGRRCAGCSPGAVR